jgi:hypothetical protein
VAVVIESQTSSQYSVGYSNNVAFDMPSGIVAGDYLVACIVNSVGNGISTVGGWTQHAVAQTGRPDVYIYGMVADGSDTLSIKSTTSAWWGCYARVFRLSGVRETDPISDTSSAQGTGYNSCRVGSVTVETNGGLALGVVGWSVYSVTVFQEWPEVAKSGANWEYQSASGSTSSSGTYYRAVAKNHAIGDTGLCYLNAPSQMDQYNAVGIAIETDPSRRFFFS